uniref:ADF-H domain-containing protein n=1 Tax=Arion vulgaris TaxID=1028688 RepID=A0A0B7AIR1_9EUPU
MASGVKVADETVEIYKTIKLRKSNIRFLLLAIDQLDGLIKVEFKKEKDSNRSQEEEFNEFLQHLPSDDGRYCILDLTIPQKNGAQKETLFILTWCPPNASTKSNMLYATSKRALLDKIREGMIDMQANDLSDLVYQEFLEKGCK